MLTRKVYIAFFYEDECQGEKCSRVRRIGRLGEVTHIGWLRRALLQMWHGCVITIIIITPQGGVVSRWLYNLLLKQGHFWEWKGVLLIITVGYGINQFCPGIGEMPLFLHLVIPSELYPKYRYWLKQYSFCHLLAVTSWTNHLIFLHLRSYICYAYLIEISWELNEII